MNFNTHKEKYNFEDLKELMAVLRSDEGCPWDREQTSESLTPGIIEEAYEVVDTIISGDANHLKEELGDLLLQVIFQAQITKEKTLFDIDDVIDQLVKKLVRRHPHVFKDVDVQGAEGVLTVWEDIKKVEKKHTSHTENLKDVPKSFPALMRAHKVQKRAAKVGFDFENAGQVREKLKEELRELERAIANESVEEMEDEFGDLLFTMVNYSRFFKLNPENALTNATEKFINRFEGIEKLATAQDKAFVDLTIDEMNVLWDTVKKINKHRESDC